MARASNSLPVPDSPRISTAAIESATSRDRRNRSSILALRVTISARHVSPAPEGAPPSRASPATDAACATFLSNSCGSNGLVKKPNTPRCVAATASGIVPCAVRIITGSVGCCALICSKSCMPSIPGIRKSVTTTAGLATAICASADSPLSAERTR